MSDYVTCPTCKGKGLVPLEDAEAIEAHASVTANEVQRAAWEHRLEMVRRDNEIRAMSAMTDAEREERARRRLAELEAAAFGPPRTPTEDTGSDAQA
jgi:uncharacterized Zn finger protein (UPF0148 family)